MMPPSARWTLGQGDALKQDCLQQSKSEKGTTVTWEQDLVDCDYRLATRVFEIILSGEPATMWLPKLDQGQKFRPLVQVLNDNSERLGGLCVTTSSWPQSPATKLQISWSCSSNNNKNAPTNDDDDESSIQSSIQATNVWVEKILCGLGLCPYTASLQRAAVGLESVGVKEGPIEIRHSSAPSLEKCVAPRPSATILAHAFWQGVTELASQSEQDVATLLILAPKVYDSEFLEFAATFDRLIEPSVQVTGAERIVGRAIFHPLYDSTLIGHENQVLPGHALPERMVEGFVDQYWEGDDKTTKPDLESIANANNAVRWTPHATINLLRRSQLTASKEAEAASPNKRPNWIYARNVLRILKK
jgi:hypothetical protein